MTTCIHNDILPGAALALQTKLFSIFHLILTMSIDLVIYSTRFN